MAYETFAKRGKRSRMGEKPHKYADGDFKPANMYAAVDFGAGHPDASRRFTNNYGKTARKRNEYEPEVGNRSRQAGRMFSWMKGESY
ncbi:MAG: hypothetical protein JRF07_05295 [Deltaproteobacteria bacterium]|jgi:hypothetical protein|nr:hypothetical protein [Deltaproteobacteria bacterium]